MNILMLGWEFPPVYSGGLGVASRNLALALSSIGANISFALPHFVWRKVKNSHDSNTFELVTHDSSEALLKITRIPSSLSSPYLSEEGYQILFRESNGSISEKTIYGKNLFEEIDRYAYEIEKITEKQNFDLLHAHDWITFPAAIRNRQKKNIPYIAHIHATEVDRTGGSPSEEIFTREREGMEKAEKIITVSKYTKTILEKYYGINGEKISVIHNGVENIPEGFMRSRPSFKNKKTALFLGRLTIQKGPDWLIKIAKRVLEYRKDVEFILGGTGEMMPNLINEIVSNGLTNNVFCLGFLNAQDREKAFENADVYVMPSVSEPFGLTAVEAAQRGVPVIMSKQSGAAEVLTNSLVADFWDTEKMANLILASFEYPELSNMLSQKGRGEISCLTWQKQAEKVRNVYDSLVF
jgi:glycogen synthase